MKAKASTTPLSLLLLLLLTYPTWGHLHANRGSVVSISDSTSTTSAAATTAFVRPKSNQPSTLSIGSNNGGENDDGILFRQAAIVGIVTATMGHVYGHILDGTVKGVWNYLPNFLLHRGMFDNDLLGHWYIPLTCSIGGLLMGILSTKLKPSSF